MARKTDAGREWRVYSRCSPIDEAEECVPHDKTLQPPFTIEDAAVVAIAALVNGATEAFAMNDECYVAFRVTD